MPTSFQSDAFQGDTFEADAGVLLLTGTGAGTGGSSDALTEFAAVLAVSAGVGGSSSVTLVSQALTGTSAGSGASASILAASDLLNGSSAGVGGGSGALTSAGGGVLFLTGKGDGVGGNGAAVLIQTGGVVADGSVAGHLRYIHPTVSRPRQLPQPVLRREKQPVVSITADDILVLWAADALTDDEALAALKEVA